MNKKLLLVLSLCVFLIPPLSVRADDVPTMAPEVSVSEPTATTTNAVSVPPVASTTPDVATSTVPVATSSEPTPTPIPSVPITLDIETQNGTLFNGAMTVTACKSTPDATTDTVTAYCAIEQSGVPAAWSWYGSDAFIDSLNGVSNDYATSAYWDWFSDLAFGMTSLNMHELHAGESVLITIGRMPLRLVLSPDTLVVESTTTVSISEFGFDANFNPVWTPAAGSTVLVNGEAHKTDDVGSFAYVPLTAGSITFTATKDGYLPAPTLTRVAGAGAVREAAPNTSAGGGHSSATPRDPLTNARDFLRAAEHTDGSFGNPLLSDWVAIALARSSSDVLRQQEQSISGSLSSATDFERHAMALEALGIDPSEMVNRIVAHFDGTQIGDPSLVNDDIFALIALSHAGYTAHDPLMQSVAAFVLKRQSTDGSWENTDLTAAAIQALVPLTDLPSVSSALARARSYLASREQLSGCFGNSFTTSWSIMAIVTLGESPDAWKASDGSSPVECLRTLQAADGGFEEGASSDTRVWATAYALPALEGRTWRDILGSYTRSTIAVIPIVPVALVPVPPTATTTLATTTDETQFASTTPTAPAPTETHDRPLSTLKPALAAHPLRTTLVAGASAALEPLPALPHPDLWSQIAAFVRVVFKILHLT